MSRLRGEITIEEIDDWFAIGAKSVKNTKSVPRTATGGRFFNTETQSARVPQEKVYVPSYNQPSYNATAYAEAYKIEEEQDLFNSQSQIPPLDETRPEISELAYILACRLIQEFDNLDIKKQGLVIYPLHSSITLEEQSRVFRMPEEGERKVGALSAPSTGVKNPYDGQLTFVGRVLAELPVDIRIGKLLMLGHVFGLLEECLIIGEIDEEDAVRMMSGHDPLETVMQIKPDPYLRRGMFCAAPFEGELYRARVESVEREKDGRSNQWIEIVELYSSPDNIDFTRQKALQILLYILFRDKKARKHAILIDITVDILDANPSLNASSPFSDL
ncbi:TDRD9 [Mytilus edulis]|uniref:TDRD9 n=1 Tax=Mytilus edulis TaxID=6550 RepID=A0A8S3QEV5_MYTED|nr:TDRD9 [Mytilus edulis]